MTTLNSSIHTENVITVSKTFIDKNISRGGSPWWDDIEFYDGAPDGLWSEEKREEFSRGLKSLFYSVDNMTNLEFEILIKRANMAKDNILYG
jgi:hypothetical protein